MASHPTETDLEREVGHPGEKWDALKERVQANVVTTFSALADEWLDLLWTLDQYRVAGIPPRGMGNVTKSAGDRLGAVYRGKGNWFAELNALILGNQTSHALAPRTQVAGFSQEHQIDVAWPARDMKPIRDPLVCLETKVTGAPKTGSRPARGAMNDWSNRRKELKFAATDLKLYRRQQQTSINHWGVWRERQMPKCYFLWAARMSSKDRIVKMVAETQALVKTYLDGAGIVAWRENATGDGYELVPIPRADQVSAIDDVLYRIASEINTIAPEGQQPPAPQIPAQTALDINALAAEDSPSYDA
jgi:hypothetical protein